MVMLIQHSRLICNIFQQDFTEKCSYHTFTEKYGYHIRCSFHIVIKRNTNITHTFYSYSEEKKTPLHQVNSTFLTKNTFMGIPAFKLKPNTLIVTHTREIYETCSYVCGGGSQFFSYFEYIINHVNHVLKMKS